MSTRRLKLYKDGSIGIGGTVLPQEAEIPAAQIGDCTISKLFGEGRTLTATRGDGRVSRFEYRHGTWIRSETSSARGPTGKKKQDKKRPDETDHLAELKRLASLPLENFHMSHAESEGDIDLHPDGTVILGSESFPFDVPIEGYRFGQSIAYRARESDILVVASPGGILWYYSWLMPSREWTHPSQARADYLLLDEGQPPRFPWFFEKSLPPLQSLLAASGKGIYCGLYISICGNVYVKIDLYGDIAGFIARHFRLRTTQIFERFAKAGVFNEQSTFRPRWLDQGRFVEIPAGRRISHRDSQFNIETRPGYVRLIHTDRSSGSPEPRTKGLVVKLEASKIILSEWGDQLDQSRLLPRTWYRLIPRQGTAGVV